MAKSGNQKLKLIYLMQILQEQTDEAHPMTILQMMRQLDRCGVEVRDRKSLYDDLEALRLYGLDVESCRDGRSCGYFVAQRTFELPELKLLVDAVQSSRFITQKKTAQLIRKVEGLASVHQAQALQRQVFVTHRIKTMNESIYYSVDALHTAIAEEKQIRFHYFEWALRWGAEKVEKQLRRQGNWYQVSPLALIWDDENYYLVAYDGDSGGLRHYRVDKMQDITLTDLPRAATEQTRNFDPGSYAETMFGMFAGEQETVRIRFHNSLIGVVVDRFGKDVFLSPQGTEQFIVTAHVAVSPQFLSWVAGFGGKARILSPASVALRLRDLLKEIIEQYEHEESMRF